MGKYFKSTYVRYIIAFIFTIIIYLIYQFLNNLWLEPIGFINSFQIAGLSLIFMGLLGLVSYFGGFDIYGYMFDRKRTETGRKEDFYEYCNRKKESRSSINLFLSIF